MRNMSAVNRAAYRKVFPKGYRIYRAGYHMLLAQRLASIEPPSYQHLYT